MKSASIVFTAGLISGLAVALGAFGAHALRDALPDWYGDRWPEKLTTWQTAVEYQMYHGLALLILGFQNRLPSRARAIAAICMTLGVIVFSGCLYALVLTDIKILGAIVPIGGTLMLVGWCTVVVGALWISRDSTTGDEGG